MWIFVADQKGNTLKPITEIGVECFMNKSKADKWALGWSDLKKKSDKD